LSEFKKDLLKELDAREKQAEQKLSLINWMKNSVT
jgi:hypothetical protein